MKKDRSPPGEAREASPIKDQNVKKRGIPPNEGEETNNVSPGGLK